MNKFINGGDEAEMFQFSSKNILKKTYIIDTIMVIEYVRCTDTLKI